MSVSSLYLTPYSGTAAVARVRAITGYQTSPVDATIYTYLADALDEVQRILKLTSKTSSTAVVQNQATYTFPADMQKLDLLSYSTALPTTPGVIEYETTELEPASFITATWNAPTISGGPIVLWRRLTEASNLLTIQLYPTAPGVGYLNAYYKSRPALWDPANPTFVPDLDASYLFCAILLAGAMAALGKENTKKFNTLNSWYEKKIADAATTVGQRKRPARATVRDVTSAPTVIPSWIPT